MCPAQELDRGANGGDTVKRTIATKRIKTHLNDYRKRLGKDRDARLHGYATRTGVECPLCRVSYTEQAHLDKHTICLADPCGPCLRWPGRWGCSNFIDKVNEAKTVHAKLRWIDKLEAELDRWAAEETTP